MTKPTAYSMPPWKAALRISAAFALCALLVFGLLWPVPFSFAAEKDAGGSEAVEEPAAPKTPVDDIDNVVVEAPSHAPAPSEPKPQSRPLPDAEPVAPDAPIVPEYERAWPIGADDASAVLAELWPDGTFVVDGSGETVAFDDVKDVPWLAAGVADDIKRVIFADKVEATSLAHWFEGCSNLSEIANVPASVEDLTRAFYDCPKLVELPDEFAFADEAVADECFGFEEPAETLLATVYRGADENVLRYAWNLDGRELVNPDAPELPTVEEPDDSAEPKDPVESETPEDSEDVEVTDDSKDLDASADESVEQPADELTDKLANAPAEEAPVPEPPAEPESEPALAPQEEAQVNITVPSSVSMVLNAEGDNTALIPVAAANRSERNVAIVGVRLKRADQDLPGGSWSLTTESGSTTFVQDARFTPLGLEATFDRPVLLAAGDENTMLVWHGTFTDYGMKTLLNATIDADGNSFAYGSMIWIVAAA